MDSKAKAFKHENWEATAFTHEAKKKKKSEGEHCIGVLKF